MRHRFRMLLLTMIALTLGEAASADDQVKLPFTVSKATTGIVGPLRTDGTVDYVAVLNERYGKGVTAENNAFVAWLKVVGTGNDILPEAVKGSVLKLLGIDRDWPRDETWESFEDFLKEDDIGLSGEAWEKADDTYYRCGRELWAAEKYPLVAAYLKKKGKVLDALAEGWKRPRFWIPYVSTDGRTASNTYQAALASLNQMRGIANSLAARALLCAQAKDFDGFLRDVMTMERMGVLIPSDGRVISHLVGIAIEALAARTIGTAAGSGRFSGEQYARLGKEMDGLPPMPPVAEAVDFGARGILLDAAVVLATGQKQLLRQNEEGPAGGAAKIWNTAVAGLEPKRVNWDEVLKRINEVTTRQLHLMELPDVDDIEKKSRELPPPMAAHDMAKQAGESEEAYSARVADWMMEGWHMASAEISQRRALIMAQMARALVAAGQYRGDNDKWPETLGDLVPRYLKAVPRDIYSEGGKGEIGYMWSGDGAVVTSVGWKSGPPGQETRRPIEMGAK